MQFKPRNPFALAARQRQAGAHEQSERARRRSERQALQQQLQQDWVSGADDACDLDADSALAGGRQSTRARLRQR
jgi:hypothetical protein